MSTYKSTYHSRIYRDFKSIDPKAYRELVRYYEKQEEHILNLPSESEYHDMLITYVNALFEIGAYRKHLLLVDHVVEVAIKHDIANFKGEDLFQLSLFRKSASLFNTHQFKEAEVILRQLVRMNASNKIYQRFLKKCLRRCHSIMVNRYRAFTVFLLFLSAIMISVEVLFVRPFYDMHTPLIEASRNTLFIGACLCWAGGWFYNRWLANRKAEKHIAKAIERSARKESEESGLRF